MKLHSSSENVTIDEIILLEKKMDIKLPNDYKDFLMKNNGGIPEVTEMFSFHEINPENGRQYKMETDIQNFSNISEIPFFYENLVGAGAIPEKYLSIACDSCGNEILLCVNEFENYGKVFFGNHEVYQHGTNYFNLSLVADSFTEFLKKIYES